MTFGEKAFQFHEQLKYNGDPLPPGIGVMNPFIEYPDTVSTVRTFFSRYFSDNHERHLLLGINPSRLGAGLTGIPFTDPKRLISELGIPYAGKMAHEPSSTFVYEMIREFGGVELFYRHFYINSPCPLGFTSISKKGKTINYNYYDNPALILAATPFMINSMRQLKSFGINSDTAFVLGTGKNAAFLQKLNAEHKFFKSLVPLEHPRFIMQYKNSLKGQYISKYISAFQSVMSKDYRS
jgi:hypothetical protein